MIRWAILTGEYPPTPGGVSDYTRLLATALAGTGDEVHVWAPGEPDAVDDTRVNVHRVPDHFGLQSLRRLDADLSRLGRPRVRILVQYVPHAYGWKAMNLPFCLWLSGRWRKRFEVMFHEVSYSVSPQQTWKHNLLGHVTRRMARMIHSAAARSWVAIPAWGNLLRRLTPGRAVPFEWLPVPSNVSVVRDPAGVAAVRMRYTPPGGSLVGHFGTFGRTTSDMLKSVLSQLLCRRPELSVLLVGRGSGAFADDFSQENPNLTQRVSATGGLEPGAVSSHLQACDVFLQLYPDGASTRRTSLMAALAHGKPVVANRGKHTESLPLERGVRLVENETNAQVRAVEELLENTAVRDQLAAAASALYDSRFDVRHTVATLRSFSER
jgi:glycosyltransferase involved in cell wall biosynthesis